MKSSGDRKGQRRLFDVHFKPLHYPRRGIYGAGLFLARLVKRPGVVDLRKRFFSRPEVRVALAVLLIVVSSLSFREFFTRAEVADFFPANCLGTWQNPQYAQGKPDTFGRTDASSTLNSENSAVFAGGESQIFCGGFIPPEYEVHGTIKSVGLTLVLRVGDQLAAESPQSPVKSPVEPTPAHTSSTPPADSTSTEPAEAPPAPDTLLTPTPPVQEVPKSATSTETPPVQNDNPESATSTETATTTTSFWQGLWRGALKPVSAQERSGDTETAPPPADESSSSLIIVAPPIEVILEPLSTSTEATSSPDVLEAEPIPPPPPDEHFLKISYSFDGASWIEVERVSLQNWSNFTVSLPVTSWDNLQKLQVSIEGIPTTLAEIPPVFLDGLLVEARYDVPPFFEMEAPDTPLDIQSSEPAAAEQPIIIIPPGGLRPVPNDPLDNSFKANDTPVLDFDLDTLPQPEPISTSTLNALPLPSPPHISGNGAKQREDIRHFSWRAFFSRVFGFRALAQSGGGGGRPFYLPTPGRPVVAQVTDPENRPTAIKPFVLVVNNQLRVSIPEPLVHFRPGRYSVQLWILRNGVIYYTEGDFLWGVLAVNFNKSIYTKGDEARAGLAVLDNRGRTICDASVDMAVISPSGRVRNFSTEKGTITREETCGPETVTHNPDYAATFGVSETGNYRVEVTARTAAGTRRITDSFITSAAPRFDVERSGPTRVFPPANYKMSITVRANEDFTGTLAETIPSVINVFAETKGDKRTQGNVQTITWSAAIKKGESAEFAYFFKVPDISPELYKTGPLLIEPQGGTAWQESRQWQIAADAAGDIILLYDTSSSTIPSGWTCISCAAGDPFFNVFPRASSTYNTASSSVDSVAHSASSSATGGGAADASSGSSGADEPRDTHTHTVSAFNSGSGSITPPFKHFVFIRSSGATTTLPNGTIGMFDVSSSSLPANWSWYASSSGNYLRGSNATTTGGSAEHNHSLSATSAGPNANAITTLAEPDGSVIAASGHTHSISGTSVNASNTPSFINVVFAKLTATSTVPNGLIAMFDNTALPTNWSIVSTSGSAYAGRLIRGSDTAGGTGGSGTHTHTTSTVTSGAPSATNDFWGSQGAIAAAGDAHTHNFPITMSATTSLPVYRDTILGKFSAPNSAPTVSNAVLNGGSAIVLTAGATTTITAVASTTDADGVGDIRSATGTIARSGLGFSCSANNLNCYQLSASGCTFSDSTSTVKCTAEIYYFAQATDSSSSFSSQNWTAQITVRDASDATGSSSTASGVELNTLVAIDVSPSSISYGTIAASSTSGSTNQTSTVKNAGNATTTLQISGRALTLGSNVIATSSQRYATSTFTVGGSEQQLSGTATDVSGFSIVGPPLGQWATSTALLSALSNHAAVTWNGYLYSTGGLNSGSAATTTAFFAPINASGSLGSWSTTTALPTSTRDHAAAAYNDYLYVIGGCGTSCTSATTTVRFASVNTSTGAIGSWTNTTALPTTRVEHAAAAYNGYLYVSGGCTALCDVLSPRATTTVYYAPINATGSLGSWATTTALTAAVADHQMRIDPVNGVMYAVGGRDGNGADEWVVRSTVTYAGIKADGTLGSWSTANSLPATVRDPLSAVQSGILYNAGGVADSVGAGNTYRSRVDFAAVDNASGTLSSWSSSTYALPAARYEHSGGIWNGFWYAVAGRDSADAVTSSVLYAQLNSRGIFWGISVPAGTATGTYSGQNTFTSVFSP